MKRNNLKDLNLRAIVESELEKTSRDGLYSPCGRCERGCSRSELFSCGKACADCRPGMQHPGTSDLKIVSVDEYREIINRIEAERKRLNEKRRAEAAANKKAERLEAKGIREEKALKKKQERVEKRKRFFDNFRARIETFTEKILAAVRTSILCKLLSGVSIGSIVFSIASIIFFEIIKFEWLASAAKAEALAAVYLFQKLFMFEAIYVFVIVAFTIGLIIVRVVRGDYKADFELENQSEEEEKDDKFFL
ncbi:hypothetical protein [Collinsella aerofaciens]|uniref:hypothetical protein n=1 Tax=Collinsella aerofaciens TaxID=74426 RepID=UPI00232BB2FE|nr:hypothetical protein [Collinsella aerofaciens]MDB1909106.1 hypothetical protein [Collinsella aerofaciens]MDB1910990.1 hypothetical protein [Collinsella aerofaciens]MDB1912894.1 hypothetical protein [Collinsella aerofaciens]